MRTVKPSNPVLKNPTKQAIRRAVASSTAIETGQAIDRIERQLKTRSSRFRNIELAGR